MVEDVLNLVAVRRDELPVWKWAEKGWMKEVNALVPYFIAILAFPYRSTDFGKVVIEHWPGNVEYTIKDTKAFYRMKDGYQSFVSLLNEATQIGELPSTTIDIYSHHWPFNIVGPPEIRYVSEYDQARKEGFLSINEHRLYTPLICKLDFREWCIRKGRWPLHEGSLLREWFPNEMLDFSPISNT